MERPGGCRRALRPPISDDRLTALPDGCVSLTLISDETGEAGRLAAAIQTGLGIGRTNSATATSVKPKSLPLKISG